MKGQQVLVKAYEGQPLLKRVWEVAGRLVYICSERHLNYRLADRGADSSFPLQGREGWHELRFLT